MVHHALTHTHSVCEPLERTNEIFRRNIWKICLLNRMACQVVCVYKYGPYGEYPFYCISTNKNSILFRTRLDDHLLLHTWKIFRKSFEMMYHCIFLHGRRKIDSNSLVRGLHHFAYGTLRSMLRQICIELNTIKTLPSPHGINFHLIDSIVIAGNPICPGEKNAFNICMRRKMKNVAANAFVTWTKNATFVGRWEYVINNYDTSSCKAIEMS